MVHACLRQDAPPSIGHGGEDSTTEILDVLIQQHRKAMAKGAKVENSAEYVPVIITCRDLGAHLNSTVNRQTGKTLTERMQKTTRCAGTMKYIKTSYKNKKRVVKGKISPMGLYGCEDALVNEAVLTRFRGAIANVVTFTTSRRSMDLTHAVTAEKGDLDPYVEICKRRVTALRRCYHRNDEDAEMTKEIYSRYQEQEEPATKHTDEGLQSKDEFGPPASKERANLRRQRRPHGPVGLLMETAHLQAAGMADRLIVKQWNQPAVDILQAPHQHLPALIQ